MKILAVLALVAGIVMVLVAYQGVPERKNMAVVEVALMAEDCLWFKPKQTLEDTLLCVRDKIDERLEELAEEKEGE